MTRTAGRRQSDGRHRYLGALPAGPNDRHRLSVPRLLLQLAQLPPGLMAGGGGSLQWEGGGEEGRKEGELIEEKRQRGLEEELQRGGDITSHRRHRTEPLGVFLLRRHPSSHRSAQSSGAPGINI